MRGGGTSTGIVLGSASRMSGGLFSSVRRLALELRRKGPVSVYSLEDEYSAADAAAWEPLIPQHYRVLGPRQFGFTWSLAGDLGRSDHDVIQLHGIWMYLSAAVHSWRRRTGRPLIIAPHGMLDPWAVSNSRWKKRLAALLYESDNLRAAGCLRALNASEAQAIREQGIRRPVAIIPNGVDLPKVWEELDPPGWLPRDGRRMLLFLGRLHPKKGLIETLQAWAIFKKAHPDMASTWRLAICGWGSGDYAGELRSVSEGLGLAGDVLFPGPVHGAEKDAAYANSDAFILASHSEGLPMAVLEAWSFRRAVLMTRECNLPEAFSAGAALEVFTNPDVLAECFAQYLDSPHLSEVGVRGHELARDHYTWASVGEAHSELHAWLLGTGRQPSFVSVE